MNSQIPRSLNRDIFETPPWESWEKVPLDVGATGKRREYYVGEGGSFPESGPWWVMWVQGRPWLVLALKVLSNRN
jgi:hypothetical protein